MNLPVSVHLDQKYHDRLVPLDTPADIPEEWRGGPIESLIRSENFREPIPQSDRPQLLIAACIEFRYALPIPRMYSYVIRRASGRLIGSEFSIAYVLSKGIEHIAMIGHNDCGMTKVADSAAAMVKALVAEGWNEQVADEFVASHAARHAIKDELDSLQREYLRLKRIFRKVRIAPLFACLADTKLYLPKWYTSEDDKSRLGAHVPDEELLSLR